MSNRTHKGLKSLGPSARVVKKGKQFKVLTRKQQSQHSIKYIKSYLPKIFFFMTGVILTINQIEKILSDVLPPAALDILEFDPHAIIEYCVGPHGLQQFEDIDDESFSIFVSEHPMEVAMISSIYKLLSEMVPGLNISPLIKERLGITKSNKNGRYLLNTRGSRPINRMGGGGIVDEILQRIMKLGPKGSSPFAAGIRWICVILLYYSFTHLDSANRFNLSGMFESMLAHLAAFMLGTDTLNTARLVPKEFAQRNEKLGPQPIVEMGPYESAQQKVKDAAAQADEETAITTTVVARANAFMETTMTSHESGLTSQDANFVVQILAPSGEAAKMANELKAITATAAEALDQNAVNSKVAQAVNAEWNNMHVGSKLVVSALSAFGSWESPSAADVRHQAEEHRRNIATQLAAAKLAQSAAKPITSLTSFVPEGMPKWLLYNFTNAISQVKTEMGALQQACKMPELTRAQESWAYGSSAQTARLTQLSSQASSCSQAVVKAHAQLSSSALSLPVPPSESTTPYLNALSSMDPVHNPSQMTPINPSLISGTNTLKLVAAEKAKSDSMIQSFRDRGIILNMFEILQRKVVDKMGHANKQDLAAVLQDNQLKINSLFLTAKIVAVNVTETFLHEKPTDVYNAIIPSMCRMALRSNSTYDAFLRNNNATQIQQRGIIWPADTNTFSNLGTNYQEDFMIHFVTIKVADDRKTRLATNFGALNLAYNELEASVGQFARVNVKNKVAQLLAHLDPALYSSNEGGKPNMNCNALINMVFDTHIFKYGLWPVDNQHQKLAESINGYYTVKEDNGIPIINPNIVNRNNWVLTEEAARWQRLRDGDWSTKLEELIYSQIPLLLFFLCTYLPFGTALENVNIPVKLLTMISSYIELLTYKNGRCCGYQFCKKGTNDNTTERIVVPQAAVSANRIDFNTNTSTLATIEAQLRSARTGADVGRAALSLTRIIGNPQSSNAIKRNAQSLLERYVESSSSSSCSSAPQSASSQGSSSSSSRGPTTPRIRPSSSLSGHPSASSSSSGHPSASSSSSGHPSASSSSSGHPSASSSSSGHASSSRGPRTPRNHVNAARSIAAQAAATQPRMDRVDEIRMRYPALEPYAENIVNGRLDPDDIQDIIRTTGLSFDDAVDLYRRRLDPRFVKSSMNMGLSYREVLSEVLQIRGGRGRRTRKNKKQNRRRTRK